jgi:hypothetical protein
MSDLKFGDICTQTTFGTLYDMYVFVGFTKAGNWQAFHIGTMYTPDPLDLIRIWDLKKGLKMVTLENGKFSVLSKKKRDKIWKGLINKEVFPKTFVKRVFGDKK